MMQSLFVRREGFVVPAAVVTMIAWAIFVVPRGGAWTGVVWIAALAVMTVLATARVIGLVRNPSMARVIRTVERDASVASARRRP